MEVDFRDVTFFKLMLTILTVREWHRPINEILVLSFPQLEELIFPQMSPQALHQWREEIVEALYFVAILFTRSA